MSDLDLRGFEHMWTTEFDDYVLIEQTFQGKKEHVIANVRDHTLLTIEDDAAYEAVIAKMIEKGIMIFDSY